VSLVREWIGSPNYSSRGGAGVRLVVVHTAEGARTYRELGNYFANSASGVSSHTGIDDTPGTIGEYVSPFNKAWTQGNANPVAVAVELCAFAAWSSEWAGHEAMLANCAAWIAEECARFSIPLRRLTAAEAQGNGRGVCGHVDLGSWGGGHWDPGPSFPWADVLAMAAGGAPAHDVPTKRKGHEMIASTSTGDGYWVVKPDGAIYSFGDAVHCGGANDAGPGGTTVVPAGHEIVGIAGRGRDGYWLTADEGSVYAFGTAHHYGRPDR
jgi:N-acetylmuramoyl-L-alanine amidase